MLMLTATQFSAPFYGQQVGGVFTTLHEAGSSSCEFALCSWSYLPLSSSPGSQETRESTFLMALTALP